MAEDKTAPGGPERVTQAPPKTKALTLQLKELPDLSDEKTPLDEYCHRGREKLSEGFLSEIVESLRQEKQLEPIKVFKDERGKWQPLTGHRRIAALYILVKQGVAGFSPSMAVAGLEVIGASLQDRLAQSVADNEVAAKLDQKERLLVVQKFAKAGVIVKPDAFPTLVNPKCSHCRDEVSSDSQHGPKVFICYRRADTADVAGRIRDRLLALGATDVFMDIDFADPPQLPANLNTFLKLVIII
jgi:hypothetical protein